jgi:hypothetical protein
LPVPLQGEIRQTTSLGDDGEIVERFARTAIRGKARTETSLSLGFIARRERKQSETAISLCCDALITRGRLALNG